MSDFEQSGVELVIGGLEAFKAGMGSASGMLTSFGDVATSVGGAALDTLGSGVDKVAGLVSGAFNAAMGVGIAGLAAFTAGVVHGAFEAEQGKRTIDGITRVLTGMGDQTDITTSQVTDLAAKFQVLAGGSDDAVLAIEDLAIKSGAISSKQLPDFIQQSLDLGAVMGDNAVAAQVLARAYEQPSSIIPKLRKEGILFTDQEEKQIKALEKAGNKAGALAIVQKKLAETTGGAALRNTQDLTGAIEIIKNVFGEAFETIGNSFLPIMQQLGGVLVDTVVPAIQDIAGNFAVLIQQLMSGGDVFSNVHDFMASFLSEDIANGVATFVTQVIDGFTSVVSFVQSNLPAMQATATSVFGSLGEAASTLGAFFTDVLAPAIGDLFGKLGGGEATSAQDVFTSVLNTITQGAADLSAFVKDPLVPALTDLVAWLGTNIPIAITALVAFWNDPLQPALAALWAFINDPLIPIMGEIAVWLGENVPIAMQALAGFWTSTLAPALTALWAYINDPLIPIIKNIATWLGVNVPIAMKAISDFWTTTLSPALKALWGFINDPLIPLLTALGTLVGETLRIAFEALVLAYNTLLKPMFDALWGFVKDNMNPTLERMQEGFQGISDGVVYLTGLIQPLIDMLKKIKLPEALTPGSPTPFEMGLRGISSALVDVTGKLQTLNAVNRGLAPIGSAIGGVGQSASGHVPLPPVIAQGSSTTNNDVKVTAVYNGRQTPGNIWQDINHGLISATA